MGKISDTFITYDMIQGAKDTETKYGVPASVTLAQILLESSGSNGGLSGLASSPNYNLFGIKAGSNWEGKTVTMRNGSGDPNKYSTYRKYNNYAESIEDHAKLLTTSRYTTHTQNVNNAYDYARAIQKAGYAEDSNYADKLINIMKQYNLTDFDKGGFVGTLEEGQIYMEENKNVSYIEEKGKDILSKIVLIITIAGLSILGMVFFIQAFDISFKPDISKALEAVKNE